MKTCCRPMGRFFHCLISVIVCAGVAHGSGPALTTVNDIVYRADGTAAAGQMIITWPSFTTADNKPVAAGQMTVTIGAGGGLNVQLAPNEGAIPAGSFYKVVYKLSDGSTAGEYWTVPAATPTTVGAIRATVVAAQVAAQLVTRQYVDTVVGTSSAQVVHRATAETITGVKTFTVSPVVPTPAASGEAASKGYVDTQAAAILHVQSDAGAANNFLTGISAAGVISKAQPSFANLSGSLACGQRAALTGDVTAAAGSCATAYAAAVPVNKGGSGQSTFSKGDLLSSPGGAVLNRIAAGADGQVLIADSAQTNGLKWASGGTLLDYQKAAAALTGDATDKTLFTYTLPAGTLAAGKGVRVTFQMQHATGTGSVLYKLFFGSTAVISQSSTSTAAGKMSAVVVNDPASTTAQQGTAQELIFGTSPIALPTSPSAAAENTANAVVIKATFNGAATEAVTPKFWMVEAVK